MTISAEVSTLSYDVDRLINGITAQLSILRAAIPVPTTVTVSVSTPTSVPVSIPTSVPTGRPVMQLGLNPWGSFYLDEPFVNIAKNWGGWTARGPNSFIREYDQMWVDGNVDKTTGYPTSIPTGATELTSGLFRFGARYFPDWYAGRYVLRWQGDAKLRFGFGMHTIASRNVSVSSHEIIGIFPNSEADWLRIDIASIGSGGIQNIELFREEHTSLIEAGEIWGPEYKAALSRYDVIRSMDIPYPMKNSMRSIDRGTLKSFSLWNMDVASNQTATDMPIAPPYELLFDLAVATSTSLWLNLPGLIGAPASFEQYSWDNGTPNGDNLYNDAKANWATMAASNEWRKLADKMVDYLISSGYPTDRILRIELGNEVWNYANPFWWLTRYFQGMGEAIRDKAGSTANGLTYSIGMGYFSAKFAYEFNQALQARNRGHQKWRMVLGIQTAWDATSHGALSGFRQYLIDNSLDQNTWMPRAYTATTSYYGRGDHWQRGVFPKTSGGENTSSWANRWLAKASASADDLKQAYTNFLLSVVDQDATLYWTIYRRAEHIAIANQYGANYEGDYEGGDDEFHGELDGYLNRNQQYKDFVEDWRFGTTHGRAVTSAWISRMYQSYPDKTIANFAGPSGPIITNRNSNTESGWVDTFYGQTNGRTQALDQFLKPA